MPAMAEAGRPVRRGAQFVATSARTASTRRRSAAENDGATEGFGDGFGVGVADGGVALGAGVSAGDVGSTDGLADGCSDGTADGLATGIDGATVGADAVEPHAAITMATAAMATRRWRRRMTARCGHDCPASMDIRRIA